MCQQIIEQPIQDPINPCQPNPCGSNAECRAIGDSPSCSCLQGFIGSAPNCRPECISNVECASNLACINNKCKDPCPNSCGQNADCRVVSHTPMCVCVAGYVGDPFTQCTVQQSPVYEQSTPCVPNPCGSNANCREQNGAGSCQCLPEYFGNPYEGCRPECVLNSDCPSNKACIRNKCQNPCGGSCGQNAECQVVNHLPSCTCILGYTGDPYRYCSIPKDEPIVEYVNPCSPSHCGPNSQCREVNGQGVCSCLPTYVGSPPGCRPECVVSSECSFDKACVNQKCINPCTTGTCGTNAVCRVNNHSPICSCSNGFTGNPFTICSRIPRRAGVVDINTCIRWGTNVKVFCSVIWHRKVNVTKSTMIHMDLLGMIAPVAAAAEPVPESNGTAESQPAPVAPVAEPVAAPVEEPKPEPEVEKPAEPIEIKAEVQEPVAVEPKAEEKIAEEPKEVPVEEPKVEVKADEKQEHTSNNESVPSNIAPPSSDKVSESGESTTPPPPLPSNPPPSQVSVFAESTMSTNDAAQPLPIPSTQSESNTVLVDNKVEVVSGETASQSVEPSVAAEVKSESPKEEEAKPAEVVVNPVETAPVEAKPVEEPVAQPEAVAPVVEPSTENVAPVAEPSTENVTEGQNVAESEAAKEVIEEVIAKAVETITEQAPPASSPLPQNSLESLPSLYLYNKI